jgi:hypothetical protein
LPHAHAYILLLLHFDDTPTEIDRIISTKVLDLNKDPQPYDVVKQFMVHSPCSSLNPNSSHMIGNKCRKHFPKKYYSETTIDEDDFPVYRKRDNGRFVDKNDIKLDNHFIVPHNINLLVKYQLHINVEWCKRSRSIKYLFKYLNKRPDCATLMLEENLHVNRTTRIQHVTISDYLNNVLNHPNIKKTKFTKWMKANKNCK